MGKEQVSEAPTLNSVEVGILAEKGGEPLYEYFRDFMQDVVSAVEGVASRQGLVVAMEWKDIAGKKIEQFITGLPHSEDMERLRQISRDAFRDMELSPKMETIQYTPSRGSSRESLFIRGGSPGYRYANADGSGGQIARCPGAE